ncbi:MAG: tetratricopeptide repeat-containing protein, partial [Phormidesmis sp.]
VPGWKRLWRKQTAPEQWCDLVEERVRVQGRRQLVKLSLLNREGEARYQLHGLVRAFLLGKLAASETAESAEIAEAGVALKLTVGFAQAMTEIAKTVSQTVTVEGRERIVEVVPHLEEVAAHRTAVLTGSDKLWCCTGLARFYKSLNLWTEAERCCKRSIAISKAELGDRHPSTATSLNGLAGLYASQGRYGEAEPLYLDALAIRKAELGDRHPDTAGSLLNLAALYYNTQRHQQALDHIRQALDIYIPALGTDHPTTQAANSWLQGIQQAINEVE